MAARAYGVDSGCHLLRFAITYPEVPEVWVFKKILYADAMSVIVKPSRANNTRKK